MSQRPLKIEQRPLAFEWLTQLAEAHRRMFPPEGSAREMIWGTMGSTEVTKRERKMLDAAFQAALQAAKEKV